MGDCFSPWKKPSDVMKLRRKKRQLESKKISDSKRIKLLLDEENENKNENNSSSVFDLGSIDSPLLRSKNPFRRNSLEISRLHSRENNNENKHKHLLDALDRHDQLNNNNPATATSLQNSQRKLRKHLSATFQSQRNKPFDEEREKNSGLEISSQSSDYPSSNGLPVDWSLKQKIRIISLQPFDWCKHLKTSEEADGVHHFLENPVTELEPIKMKETEADKWKSSFQKECLYWIHPNLPWMKMFPRIQNERSLQSFPLGDAIYASLQADWLSSFHSAFGQLKSGHCPYFYFCTHQLSVLFRRTNRTASLSAIVTPTTRGIREALTAEGIQFKMPFDFRISEKSFKRDEETSPKTNQNASQESSSPPNDEHLDGEMDLFDDDDDDDCHDKDDGLCDADSQKVKVSQDSVNSQLPVKADRKCDNDDDDDDDASFAAYDGAAVWLESIGLDKKNFPSLDPMKVKLNRDGFKKIDSRPESTIFLETDIDVNALFNFLLNWKSCFAAAGPQFGIPPTILSPSGFKGAVLKAMKVKHSVVFLPEENQKGYVLEIVGPLLPCHVRGFVEHFQETQAKQFSMVLNTHETTSPFNITVDSAKNGEDLNSDDHHDNEALSFLDFKTLRSITQIKCTPSGVSWS